MDVVASLLNDIVEDALEIVVPPKPWGKGYKAAPSATNGDSLYHSIAILRKLANVSHPHGCSTRKDLRDQATAWLERDFRSAWTGKDMVAVYKKREGYDLGGQRRSEMVPWFCDKGKPKFVRDLLGE